MKNDQEILESVIQIGHAIREGLAPDASLRLQTLIDMVLVEANRLLRPSMNLPFATASEPLVEQCTSVHES